MICQIPTQFYHSEHFGINEGLAHGVIGDFCVDHRGLIWLVTVQGLQQFDGHQFRSVKSPDGDELQFGDLSFSQSGFVFLLNDWALYNFQHPDTLLHYPKRLVLSKRIEGHHHNRITYESPSHLYIQHHSDTVFRVRKSDMVIDMKFLLPVRQHRYFQLNEFDFHFALKDQYEYIGEDMHLYRYHLVHQTLDTLDTVENPRSVIKLSQDMFAVLESRHLDLVTSVGKRSFPIPDETVPAGRLLKMTDQELLVVLHAGIYQFDFVRGKWTGKFIKSGIGSFYDSHTRHILKDHDQNVYMSTFTSGLVKLYPRNPGFQYIGVNEKDKHFVRCISGSDTANVVLMGTLQHGLFAFDTLGNLRLHFKEFPDQSPNPYIKTIIKLGPHRFYILGQHIYEMDVTAEDIDIRKVQPFPYDWYNFYSGIMPDAKNGKYYMPSWQGLLTIDPDKPNQVADFQFGHILQSKYAFDLFRGGYIAAGFDSIVWMDATLQHVQGLWKVRDMGFIRSLRTEDDHHILMASDRGLFRIALYDTAVITHQLYDKMAYAILPDVEKGAYWFTTDYGIFHASVKHELTQYSIETGVQENEFNSNVLYMSESGKYYFGGINGITSFYPGAVSKTTDHIRTYVASITSNHTEIGRYLSDQTPHHWTFSHDESNIGIELLGKGRRSPATYNYQYKIPELQPDWVDMGHDPKIQFHLQPGTYTFHYYAGDHFDPQADAMGQISWTIRPPFYQQGWFILLTATGVGSIAFYFLQLNRRRRELKIRYDYQVLERLQTERVRISRELHDNIGAQMATVKRNLSFLVQHRSRLNDEQVMEKMENLEAISTQINQELRDTIWAVQHESISIGDFINRFKAYVFQVVKSDEAYRVHYEEKGNTDDVLSPFVALNLHRICQEAINNTLKHADANTIRIEFESEVNLLHISISDNGKGFDLHGQPMGYGLSNMRQRAEQIRAQLYIESNTFGGTTIRIVLPSTKEKGI